MRVFLYLFCVLLSILYLLFDNSKIWLYSPYKLASKCVLYILFLANFVFFHPLSSNLPFFSLSFSLSAHFSYFFSLVLLSFFSLHFTFLIRKAETRFFTVSPSFHLFLFPLVSHIYPISSSHTYLSILFLSQFVNHNTFNIYSLKWGYVSGSYMASHRFATYLKMILLRLVMLKCKETLKNFFLFFLVGGIVKTGVYIKWIAMLCNKPCNDPIWILSINTLWLSGFARKNMCTLPPMKQEFA